MMADETDLNSDELDIGSSQGGADVATDWTGSSGIAPPSGVPAGYVATNTPGIYKNPNREQDYVDAQGHPIQGFIDVANPPTAKEIGYGPTGAPLPPLTAGDFLPTENSVLGQAWNGIKNGIKGLVPDLSGLQQNFDKLILVIVVVAVAVVVVKVKK